MMLCEFVALNFYPGATFRYTVDTFQLVDPTERDGDTLLIESMDIVTMFDPGDPGDGDI